MRALIVICLAVLVSFTVSRHLQAEGADDYFERTPEKNRQNLEAFINTEYPLYLNDYPFLPTSFDQKLYKNADSDSFPIMQAPVALSNPIWNLITRASSMYRLIRRSAPDDVYSK